MRKRSSQGVLIFFSVYQRVTPCIWLRAYVYSSVPNFLCRDQTNHINFIFSACVIPPTYCVTYLVHRASLVTSTCLPYHSCHLAPIPVLPLPLNFLPQHKYLDLLHVLIPVQSDVTHAKPNTLALSTLLSGSLASLPRALLAGTCRPPVCATFLCASFTCDSSGSPARHGWGPQEGARRKWTRGGRTSGRRKSSAADQSKHGKWPITHEYAGIHTY